MNERETLLFLRHKGYVRQPDGSYSKVALGLAQPLPVVQNRKRALSRGILVTHPAAKRQMRAMADGFRAGKGQNARLS